MKKQMVFISLIMSIVFATSPAWADLRCEIIDLGTIIDPGTLNNDTYASSINDLGQVVGISGMAAFLWDSNNGMTHITVDMEPINIHVSQINNAGQIAGTFGLWENGTINDLGISFEPWWGANCTGINDTGQVVGIRYVPEWIIIKLPSGEEPIKYSDDIVNRLSEDAIIRYEGRRRFAFIWDPVHGAKDIGVLCDGSGTPWAINNAGQVAGWKRNTNDPNWFGNALIWDSNTQETIDIGTLGFGGSSASDINNKGQVVGSLLQEKGYLSNHAFFWDESEGMIDIGTLYGDYAEAAAINDAGLVVGISGESIFYCRAFLWSKDLGMVDLTELLPVNSGWDYLSVASDINNHGQIVGEGITTTGQRRAFLINLVIDPIDVALLDIQDAMDEKLEALENLNASLQNERMALAVLSEMLKAKDYNGLRRVDLTRARIRTVRSLICELKAKRELNKSIRDLRMALEHLSNSEVEGK